MRQNPKYGFSDGVYHSKVAGESVTNVYVHNDDQIAIYPVRRLGKGFVVDTSVVKPLYFSMTAADSLHIRPLFRKNSFDIDFLTIPFKYRFALKDFPRQFNTNLNGAVYVGYRSDIYILDYNKDDFRKSSRHTSHVGFSFGAFSGLGGTAMNPSVTNNVVAIEYDGVVWSKGLSGIIAVNNFTTGLAFGWDHLLDQNRKFWIYQNRPWLGVVFGLNLN